MTKFKVGRNAEPYVKVVVEMEVLAFPHVRKRVLRRFPDQASNYMPKVAFEEVVFRFIRELGYEFSDGVYEGSVPITVQDGCYHEDLYYVIRPDKKFYSPSSFREYVRFMDKMFGKIDFDFD